MIAHHKRIKFLFGLLFYDTVNPIKLKTKTKEERKKDRESKKEYLNMRRRIWRKEINCWQSDNKIKNRRKKELGFLLLNSRFNGSAAHHIDKERVIHIPKDLHNSFSHNLSVPESMIEINWEAFKFLMNEMTA